MGSAGRLGGGSLQISAGGRSVRSAAVRSALNSPALGSDPAGQITEIQRTRLLGGALGAIEELGYTGATVTQITSRARVSRRTFYELFEVARPVCWL